MSQKTSDRQRLLPPASLQGLNSKKTMLKLLRWSQIAGATSVMSLAVSVMPALAEELSDWNYDTETRSLNITLPATTKPTISVTADDQLLVELPNTQVGRAIGQTVFDGVVESIVLEQATPETVWIVVDFTPGTILASAQSATSIVSSETDSNGMRQWQVRPELMATRRVSDAIATLSPEQSTAADAAALRPELPDLSIPQATFNADFPELPILEPAVPINEPITVPPITARAAAPVQPASLLPIEVSLPPAPTPAIVVPTITEADAVENETVSEPVVAVLKPEVPFVLPLPPEEPEEAFVETFEVEEVEETAIEAASVATEEIESDAIEVEVVAPIEVEVVAPVVYAPAVALSAPTIPEKVSNEPPAIVIPEIDLSANEASQSINSRWPEPIPFGQPLP